MPSWVEVHCRCFLLRMTSFRTSKADSFFPTSMNSKSGNQSTSLWDCQRFPINIVKQLLGQTFTSELNQFQTQCLGSIHWWMSHLEATVVLIVQCHSPNRSTASKMFTVSPLQGVFRLLKVARHFSTTRLQSLLHARGIQCACAQGKASFPNSLGTWINISEQSRSPTCKIKSAKPCNVATPLATQLYVSRISFMVVNKIYYSLP